MALRIRHGRKQVGLVRLNLDPIGPTDAMTSAEAAQIELYGLGVGQ